MLIINPTVKAYKPTKLTMRQKRYMKNRIAGMNQYNAARAAGYSHNFAKQACRIEKVVNVRFIDLCEQAGLTDKYLIDFIQRGLDATKPFGKDAEIHDDWNARHKFLETLLKLTERLKERKDIVGTEVNVHVHPNKTYIFRDITDADRNAGQDRVLHAAESAESIGREEAVQDS